MNPTFALEIAPDTLTLSHRRFGAWHSLGTVRRDDPRCPQRMDELRRTADWLEPNSIRTAVVVASSQVMFLTVALPSNSRGNKRREIREALKTATPFPVEDIEFDFVSEDGGARVAIVAKTALAEAIATRRQPATFRMQQGYDHSYYFVASFMEDHVAFHAEALWG